MGYEPVGEFTHERIGSDAREAVGATTLQTDTQFRYRNLRALVLLGDGIEVAEDRHASLHLIFNFLSDQEFDAVLVIVAQHRHEVVGLVVLTTQTQYEDSTCIRMQTDVAQYLTGVLVIA